jgi:hypothetical protein
VTVFGWDFDLVRGGFYAKTQILLVLLVVENYVAPAF